jgi:hypothetical protein
MALGSVNFLRDADGQTDIPSRTEKNRMVKGKGLKHY